MLMLAAITFGFLNSRLDSQELSGPAYVQYSTSRLLRVSFIGVTTSGIGLGHIQLTINLKSLSINLGWPVTSPVTRSQFLVPNF